MIPILQSVLGGHGPLIVEHGGKLHLEPCVVIEQRHIENVVKLFEIDRNTKIVQTTDRSFIID
jgi:hypothetical protein